MTDKETTFDDYLKEQLKDPEFRKEWEKLCDEDAVMSNDLISRSELLGKFMAMLTFSSDRVVLIENVIEQIQNAPTVEYPFYAEAYQTGYEEGKNERPHGKWVKSKDGYMRCDQCGSRGSAIKARFCHHCGADMRGKEE